MRLNFIILFSLLFFSCSHTEKETPTINLAEEEKQIHQLMDGWHKAASNADAKGYFGAMDSGAVFLGTDPSERWPKDTFEVWAKPFFDRGKAWSFSAHDRIIYFTKDANTAWFEELLDTWMGTCRGVGVVGKGQNGWKIKHYNLAILVPNNKVNAYLEILKDTIQ